MIIGTRADMEFYVNRHGRIVLQLGGEQFWFRDSKEARLVAAALVHKADEIDRCSGVDGHADSERAQNGRA